MSKAVRISAPMTVSASSASSEKSDGNALVSIALFSELVCISLVAILFGMPGVWY